LFGDLDRTAKWCFQAIKENKRHPVPGRNPDQPVGRFRSTDLLGVSDDSGKSFLKLALLVEQQLRVTDQVHEQDVTNLQPSARFSVNRHGSLAHRQRLRRLNSAKNLRRFTVFAVKLNALRPGFTSATSLAVLF